MGRPQLVTRAAAYLRVSTDKQDLEVQLTEIRQHAVRRGWELVETYSDIASGARDDRLGFRRLLADATKRKFDVIVVQRFDRAARSVKQLVQALEHSVSAELLSSRSKRTSTPPLPPGSSSST